MPDAYDFWAARITGDRLIQIEALWTRFLETAPRLAAELALPKAERTAELHDLMTEVLGPLDDRLEYEFEAGPTGDPRHTLVITAGQRHGQRVLARAVREHAPDLPGWTFSDSRDETRDPADALELIRERDGGHPLLLRELEAWPGDHNRIDAVPKGAGPPDELARQAGIAVTTLLGEETSRDWLGRHEPLRRGLIARLAGAVRGQGDAGWCEGFRSDCLDLIDEVRGRMPDRPFWETSYDRANQIMYRANTPDSDPGWRHDTLTGYTGYRAMAQARMSGDPLASARFSRFGESFCGLKVARTAEFHFDETEQRVALAEGAHMMLSTREEGGVTGEAHGRAHVYIDLALTDLAGGVATLAELLDKIELTGPAWLIFDEAGLTDLVVPLTPRTPPQPREEYG